MTSPKFEAEVRGKGIARSSMSALALTSHGRRPPCLYPAHRPTDWRRDGGGPLTCGVCHPPAPGVPIAELET